MSDEFKPVPSKSALLDDPTEDFEWVCLDDYCASSLGRCPVCGADESRQCSNREGEEFASVVHQYRMEGEDAFPLLERLFEVSLLEADSIHDTLEHPKYYVSLVDIARESQDPDYRVQAARIASNIVGTTEDFEYLLGTEET